MYPGEHVNVVSGAKNAQAAFVALFGNQRKSPRKPRPPLRVKVEGPTR